MHEQQSPAEDSGPAVHQRRLPPWLKRPVPVASALLHTRKLINGLRLNTVCVEARCPNLTECWSRHTATFMILGDTCTRLRLLCQHGRPNRPTMGAQRLAEAAAPEFEACGDYLRRATTCRTRAGHTLHSHGSAAASAKHDRSVGARFSRPECVQAAEAGPEVFNHNLEVVEAQQKRIRPQADYRRSLRTLELAKEHRPSLRTKSGLMVGVGETRAELLQAFKDLRAVGCDFLTIGQYLKPKAGAAHVPVERYYPPDEFRELGDLAKELGFLAVASGPFVRSSYLAETLYHQP